MALTKITSAIIESGAIDATALANNSITIDHLDCSDGTSGQFLKTDGSGNLSFASVPAGYTDSDVESYLSGGTGVTFSSGVISIGQDVATSSTPTFGNITTTGYIAGPATFTIDPAAVGDNTGTVVIAGNLQVDGTTTTINSTTMEVDDLNITLASGAANAAAANGAGITVDGASATITYDGTNDEWDFNKDINVTGAITASGFTSTGIDDNATSTAITIDSSGRVGINRTPAISNSKLEVGGADNVPLINVEASGATGGMGIGSTGLQFFHGSTARMSIDSSGKVGIGTGTPQKTLHIEHAEGVSEGVLITGASDTSGNTTGILLRVEAGESDSSVRAKGGIFFERTGTYGVGKLHLANDGGANNDSATISDAKLTIDSSGNVGIGKTPNRSRKLEVAGDINLDNGYGLEWEDGGVGISGSGATDVMTFATAGVERMRINNSGDVQLMGGNQMTNALAWYNTTSYELASIENISHPSYNDSGGLLFKTAGLSNSGMAERMRIDSSGNVGIGTTSTNQRLTVNLPGRNDTETNSLAAAVVAGPISGPPVHDFTNSNCIFRVQGTNATNNIQFGVGNGLYGYNPWIQASYDNSSAVHTDHNAKHLLIQPIGGSVAIGKETYASAKLEVVGSIYSNNEGGSSYSSYGTGAELRVINLSVNQSAIHYIEIGGNLPGYTAGQYNCLSTDLNDLHFAAGGVYTGYISYNTGFVDVSDEREKENITTITNATAKLKQLRGVYHTWKDTANRGTDTTIGLIAQEVEAVVPEVVTTSNPTSLNTPESDTDGLKGVAYAKLVPLLIETIKELEARITTLEG